MEKRERQRLTKEVSLEAGYRFFKFVSGSEYLHFGLFEADIPPTFQNLKQAQDRYLERLIEIIPPHARTILDVGAGSGKTAEVLIERGFEVDCVSPGKILGDVVAQRLGSRSVVYRAPFEEAVIPKHYDVVLFSESFQYIPISAAIPKAISLLNPNGHILICDFFRRPGTGRSLVGGGHALDRWETYLAEAPLDVVYEKDITEETAPVLDIINAFYMEVAKPLAVAGGQVASARWPMITRIARFFLRRDLEKLERKRFSGRANAAEFKRTKVYRTYLLKHRPS